MDEMQSFPLIIFPSDKVALRDRKWGKIHASASKPYGLARTGSYIK